MLPFAGEIQFSPEAVALRVTPFPMHQVRLTGGIYKDAEEWNRGYMSRLDADRLLYNFRASNHPPDAGILRSRKAFP